MERSKRSLVALTAACLLAIAPISLVHFNKPIQSPAATTSAPFATPPPQKEAITSDVSAEIVEPEPTPIPPTPTPSTPPPAPPTPLPTAAPKLQPLAQPVGTKTDWMRAAGIPESDWGYVDYIITRESGWNPNAVNKSSGACGLGQQLPCGKWAHTWNDPVGGLIDANNYAIARYGTWANAVSFWQSKHWW